MSLDRLDGQRPGGGVSADLERAGGLDPPANPIMRIMSVTG